MYYGANAKGELNLDAQVYGLKGTYSWKLVTMVDRNGNRVEYSYFKDGSQSYMDQIAWVFDKSDKPLYQLKFNYEERPDHISDGKPGFDLKTTKRIKEVRITSDGTRFRSYSFDYEDATGLSRLIKVTRYGRDATKAYPVEFTMKYSDAVFSQENSKMVTMPTSLGVDFRSGNIDFIDINGDGLPDVVDTSKPKHVFFINQVTLKDDIKQDGHDFPKGLIKENLQETSAQLSNPSIQMIDYNGDGFTDMVDAVNKKIYINKGNSKWEDSSTSLQSFPVTGKDPNMRFMDYDGDKKIDVISSDGSSTTFWVSDGKGNWVVTPGKTNIGLGFDKDRLKLIDINGDGLQDVVHITKNSMRYRKYLGYGEWTDWIDMKVPGIDQYELSTQAQFDDINGDGMADMVAFLGNSIVYFVNKNGIEFEAGKKLQTFKGVDIPDSSKMTIRILDINGNGSRDIVWIDSSGRVTYLELFGKRPNLMEAISNGIGQRINVEYGSSVNFYLRDQTCKVGVERACEGPWQNKMPMPFTVVTKITTWASRADKPLDQAAPTQEERPQIQYVFYHNGFYDGVEKTFRGFRKVETLYDGDTSVKARKDTLSFDVGDTDAYRHGRLLAQQIADDEGHTYQQSRTEWGDCAVDVGKADAGVLDPPIRFICRKSQEIQHIEGEQDAAKWKTTRTELVYDGFGNVTQLRILGEIDAKGDEKYTQTTYITPANASDENAIWNLRSPATILRCDAPPEGNQDCAETQHFYDGESFKGMSLGQLRNGNVTRVIDPDRSETRYIYNQQNLLSERIDAQGRTLVWGYDELGRPHTLEEKDKPETRITSTYDIAQPELPTTINLKGKLSRITYPGGMYLFSYDQKGQPQLERHILMGIALDVKRTFDTSGKVLSRIYPDGTKVDFKRDGAGRILSSPGLFKEIVYDPQGTTQSVLLANGLRTNYTYNTRRWLTGIKVADGAVFRLGYTFDDVGNIVKSEQQHGSKRYDNTYEYDALYRLTQATLGETQEIITYQQNDLHNILSRRSSLGDKSPAHLGAHQYHETKIHALTSAGGSKLSYDRAGYLSQKDNQTLHWDGHGRLQRVEVDGASIAQHWYGTQRKRLIKEAHGVHTFYVDDLFEIRDGVGVSYIKLGANRLISMRSPAIAATFFDDLAPASGDKSLTAKPDGQILASDAWLYHAAQAGFVTIAVKKRPLPLSLTQDMLRSSLSRMLDGDKPITRYHHVDHLGNVLATTDEKGAVLARTAYYPYGAIRQSSGPLPTYAYMGAELDQATQTYRFSQRSMDSKLGRWWSPDPAFAQIHSTNDEFNSYGMLRNNPIRMREYMGNSSVASVAVNGIVDGANIVGSFLSSEQFADITDWGLVGISTAGALFASFNALTGDRIRPSDGGGLRAAKRLKKIGNVLSAMSWSLWGTTAGARLAGASDTAVNTLNVIMLSFATMSEAFTTIGLITEQKSKGRSTFKGRKSLIAARALTTLAMAASLATTAIGQATDNEAAQSAGSILAVATSLISVLGNEKIVNKVAIRIKRKKALKDVAARIGNALKQTRAQHPQFKQAKK